MGHKDSSEFTPPAVRAEEFHMQNICNKKLSFIKKKKFTKREKKGLVMGMNLT